MQLTFIDWLIMLVYFVFVLGIDVNLIWGGLMFVFGLVLYLFGRRPRRIASHGVEHTVRPLH